MCSSGLLRHYVAPSDLLQTCESRRAEDQKPESTCCCWFVLDESGENERHFLSLCREVQDIVLIRRFIVTDTIVVYILVRIKHGWAPVAVRLAVGYHFVYPVGDESIPSFLASVGGALLRTTAEPLEGWSLADLLKGSLLEI